MLKTLDLPLSYIIVFGIMGQIAGIFAIKLWGKHSDKYRNKTIIKIAAPLYILCILSWPFAAMAPSFVFVALVVAVINTLSGIGNIGLKLASKEEAIVYLTVKNMVVACFASLGPIVGGILADYFSNRSFIWNFQWQGPHGISIIPLLHLHSLSFLFIIGGVLAFIALKSVALITEEGEISKDLAIAEMRTGIKSEFKNRLKRESILALLYSPVHFHSMMHKKLKNRIENRLVNMRKLRNTLVEKRTA